MKIRGIRSGMVMQRNLQTNEAQIICYITEAVMPTASFGCLNRIEGEKYSFTGLPVGGPYAFTIQDGEQTLEFTDVYVGDVWILGGQSNMEGAGLRRREEYAYDEAPEKELRSYSLADIWAPATSLLHQQWLNTDLGVREKYYRDNQDHLERLGSFTPENHSGVGPGHFIGLRLLELAGVPQGLIPCAYGGASLWDFSPDNHTDASLYYSMLRRVVDCGGRARGIFWYQGESQAGKDWVENFCLDMERFVTQLRLDLESPALPVVQVQIGHNTLPWNSTDEADLIWHRVRVLQMEAQDRIENLTTVSAANSYLQDLIHIDAQSHSQIGKAMAEEMIRLLTDQGTAQPQIEHVTTMPHPEKPKHSTLICITYKNLVGKLISKGRPYGFSVTVGEELPFGYPYKNICHIQLEGNQVIITVEDNYVDIQKACLWYGAGRNCICNITDEGGRALPAFGPRKII